MTAVVVHLYFPDLWEEMCEAIDRVGDKKVFLSVSSADLRDEARRRYPGCRVELVRNRGMDVEPFVRFLPELAGFDRVLKLHGKKSLRMPPGVGTRWRRSMLDALTRDVDRCAGLLADDVGMLGPEHVIATGDGRNEKQVSVLRGLLDVPRGKTFVAGTMFWVRTDAYRWPIDALLSLLETEPVGYLTDGRDGTYVHALERVLGYAVESAGRRIVGIR